MPRKILLLSVSAGAGHVRAAEALLAQAQLDATALSASHLDVLQFVPASLRALYTDFYIALVNKHPALWGYLYQMAYDTPPNSAVQKLRRGIERVNTRALLTQIAAAGPDAIICTHFLPAEILSRLLEKGALRCPVWVQITDFDVHRMWVHPHISGYFAATEEVAHLLRALGVAASAIHVSGIPVMPAFSQVPARQLCAREFGIDADIPTLLLMGGGAGLGQIEQIAAQVLALPEQLQLIAVAGNNAEALQALRCLQQRYPQRLLARGYERQIERAMACADLIITKPGGLTVSECLAMGLPMILNPPIPGPEERNADYLLEQGVALKAPNSAMLEYRIRYLLQHPAKLAEMRRHARLLGRPEAARTVLDTVLAQTND